MKRFVKLFIPKPPDFGFKVGRVYPVCDCPAEYEKLFKKEVWIFSEMQNYPVMLNPGEYTPATIADFKEQLAADLNVKEIPA